MKRRALYLIVVMALVLGMALPMATSVMASGIGGSKTTAQDPEEPHPVDRYIMGQTIYYSLRIDNRSSTEDMIVKIRDRIPLDPATSDEIPGVTTTYWWNNDTSQWVLSDPDTPVTIPPDGSWNGTFEYEIIEDGVLKHPVLDIDVWVNELLASGTQGPDTVNYAQAKTVRVIQPGIELQKDVTPGVAEVGQNVTYTFTITNTGDWPLENITIEDDKLSDLDLQAEIPGDLVLAVYVEGQEDHYHSFTYEYTIQEGDLPLENTATVWGTAEGFDPAIGVAVVSDSDDAEVILDADPSIAIEKAVWDGEGWDDADTSPGPYLPDTVDPVIFRIVITNTGNVDLTNVDLTDTDIVTFYEDFDCTTEATFPIATLADGATPVTVYGKLDWAIGQHANTATATGTPPVGDPVSDTDMAHYFGVDPSIDLQKAVWDGEYWRDADTPPGPYLPDSGDAVVFRFVITNDGNVPLSNVTLSDTHMSDFYIDEGLTTLAIFPIATLAAGMSDTFYGSLAWTAGQHSNNATATGTPADEPDVSAGDDCHYFGSESSIDIQKAVWDGGAWHDADTATGPYLPDTVDPVVFRFIITNDGSSPLNNVTLSDTHMSDFYTDQGLTNSATFPISTLAANVSATFYGSLDWAIGQHSNTATATGTPPDEPAISASNDCHYFGVGAYIDLQKAVWHGTWHDADTPTGPYLSDSGDAVVFRFVITNAGSVNLTNVVLDDSDIDQFYTDEGLTIPAVFPIASLAPTVSVTVYGSLPWTAGQHSNTATATGTPPDDPDISASDDCHYFGRTDITVGWDGQSVNKVAVLAPWIALMMGTIACAVLFVRRRQAQG